MKKLTTLMVAAALVLICGCGPSAKEKEAKRIADSTRVADSLAVVQANQKRVADSIAQVQAEQQKIAAEKAHQDSIAKHLIKKAKPAGTKKAHK